MGFRERQYQTIIGDLLIEETVEIEREEWEELSWAESDEIGQGSRTGADEVGGA